MKTKFFNQTATTLILGSLLGCHQEPVLPTSIVPETCRIGQVEYTNEGYTSKTDYEYDAFGNLTKTTGRSIQVGGSYPYTYTSQTVSTYSADRYLTGRQSSSTNVDSRFNPPIQTSSTSRTSYEYEGSPKRIVRVTQTYNDGYVYTEEYTYDGSRLSTYKTGTRTYRFGADGKLTTIESSSETNTIVNGKVVKRLYSDGYAINREFDSKGQETKYEYINPQSKTRTVYTYIYDAKPFYNQGQLRLRGFPVMDLGFGVQQNNLLTENYKSYQNEVLVSESTTTFSHQYNQAGYSLSIAGSTGARTKYYYTNCP